MKHYAKYRHKIIIIAFKKFVIGRKNTNILAVLKKIVHGCVTEEINNK